MLLHTILFRCTSLQLTLAIRNKLEAGRQDQEAIAEAEAINILQNCSFFLVVVDRMREHLFFPCGEGKMEGKGLLGSVQNEVVGGQDMEVIV